jgi:hypothetical protein
MSALVESGRAEVSETGNGANQADEDGAAGAMVPVV